MDHVLAIGNKEVNQFNKQNEFGYFTVLPNQINNSESLNVRQMGHVNTGLIRLLVECALYLASLSHSEYVKDIVYIQPAIKPTDLPQFFYDRLVSTLNDLAGHLQTSVDECLLFVHFVLSQALVKPTHSTKKSIVLKSKKDREKVENEFCRFVNEQILTGDYTVERLIGQFTAVLRDEAMNSESDMFFRIAYDLIEPSVDLESNETPFSFLNQAYFWKFRKQISIKSFVNTFNLFWRNSIKQDDFKLLKKFVDQLEQIKVFIDHILYFIKINIFPVLLNENILVLKTLKKLPNIINTVRLLHMTFNRQLDTQTASNLSVAELIETNPVLVSNRELITTTVRDFIELWSKLSSTMSVKLSARIVSQFAAIGDGTNLLHSQTNDLTDVNKPLLLPVSYLLPSRHGDGIYIYALIVFLIDVHNDLVQFHHDLYAKKPTRRIDLDAITNNECFDVSDRHLLNIVYINSNYTLESIKELNLEFNYAMIQESLEDNFFIRKPIIDSTVYQNDLINTIITKIFYQ